MMTVTNITAPSTSTSLSPLSLWNCRKLASSWSRHLVRDKLFPKEGRSLTSECSIFKNSKIPNICKAFKTWKQKRKQDSFVSSFKGFKFSIWPWEIKIKISRPRIKEALKLLRWGWLTPWSHHRSSGPIQTGSWKRLQTKSNQVIDQRFKNKYWKAPAREKICNKGGLLVSHRLRDGYKAHREGIVVTKLTNSICNKLRIFWNAWKLLTGWAND